MSLKETLIEIEEQYWNAAGNAGFYRDHLADDALMIFGIGILDKDQTVKSQDEAGPWTGFTIDDPKVIDIADDVAALVYTTVASQAGVDVQYMAAVSSVYTRRNGAWKLVLHHQTPQDI